MMRLQRMTVFGTILMISGVIVVLILLLAGLAVRSYQEAESKSDDYDALLDVHERTSAAYVRTLEMMSTTQLAESKLHELGTMTKGDTEEMEIDPDE